MYHYSHIFATQLNSQHILWAAFASFLIAFVFVIFIFYRQRRELHFRQKEAELGRQIAEVEMKALRAQMNPHFIFNALNSVYRFMQNNDLKNAGGYLLKVSALMRMVLENSLHKSIALHDDLETMKLYMEIEQVRLQNNFIFSINISDDVAPETTYVPPLILQPFIENAIWHGLKNKKGDGLLSIHVSKKEDMLHLVIEDNGEQSNEEREITSTVKKKSLGLNLTRERLDVLNEVQKTKANFSVSDRTNSNGSYAGRKIVLELPLEEL